MLKKRYSRLITAFKGMDRTNRILVSAFLVAGLITAALAFNLVRGFIATTTSIQLPGLALQQGETNGDPSGPSNVQQIGPQLAPWDGKSRVTILVMGLDYRDWEAGQGAPRTDSMILLTIDPVTKTAGILSVPRDLWVEVPGFGHQKINAAYQLGEGSRLPGGGPGLAVETVEQFLGITINYYAQIDFTAFERFIDEIGGVKIEITKKIKVQVIGEEDLIKLEPGRYTLPGNIALAYARSRHTEDGDFDRARRQQQLIIGIRNQLLRPDVQALILGDGIRVYQELSSGVNTNMSFTQILQLGLLAAEVKLDNIQTAVIAPPDQVTLGTSPDGLSILKPITQNIRLLRDQIFSSGSVRSAVARNSESSQLMQMEAAIIALYNGSGIEGLAGSTQAYLQGLGLTIATTGTADPVGGTTIFDYTGNPYTIAYLVEVMGVQHTRIYSRYDPNSQIDMEVIIGPDWAIPAQ
ncbi:MAG: LCP family protein [Chloroflexi bacterium]|nr:LCP family protein [Chloroflexota bacterium]